MKIDQVVTAELKEVYWRGGVRRRPGRLRSNHSPEAIPVAKELEPGPFPKSGDEQTASG